MRAAILTLLTAAAIFAVVGSTPVALAKTADFCDDPAAKATEYCQDKAVVKTGSDNRLVGPDGVITQVAEVLTYLTVAISVVVIIIAGLRFILSGGNPDSVSRARNSVIHALVGIVIVVSAQAIIVFVLNKL